MQLAEITIGSNDPFSEALLSAVDAGFSTLGEPVKELIYHYLEAQCGIEREDIPLRITDFQTALERLLGVGARHLEILFMKKLQEQLKTEIIPQESCKFKQDLTFQQYLAMAKTAFQNLDQKFDETEK